MIKKSGNIYYNSKKSLIFVLFFMITIAFAEDLAAKDQKSGPSLNVSCNKDKQLSVDVKQKSLKNIFSAIEEKAKIKFTFKGIPLPDVPIDISLKEEGVNQVVKALIKAGGVQSHLLNFKTSDEIEIHVLNVNKEIVPQKKTIPAKKTVRKRSSQRSTNKTNKRSDVKKDGKIKYLQNKFNWENDKTKQLAGYLVEIMPSKIWESGYKALLKAIEESTEKNGKTVNEDMLVESIISTVPPKMKDYVRESTRKHVEGFKGTSNEFPKVASDKHFNQYMKENR